jgi:2,3-bisphosphoglycerate-dependent phosphoglycerate mutase
MRHHPEPTEIVLVRHAVSVPRTADGPDEVARPLSPRGLRQARELVPVLTDPRPAAVWSSPYRRAIQTVQPTAAALGLPVQTHRELGEWDDGLAYTDDWEPHCAQSWANPSYARPGGDSLEQLRTRAVDSVRTLVHQYLGQVVLAAGHGTSLPRRCPASACPSTEPAHSACRCPRSTDFAWPA